MDADGNGETRLTNNPAYDTHPDWSPDRIKIAFGTNRHANREERGSDRISGEVKKRKVNIYSLVL